MHKQIEEMEANLNRFKLKTLYMTLPTEKEDILSAITSLYSESYLC